MKKKRDSGFLVRGNWQKFLLVMKLKLFLILITCCQVTAAVHSQNKLLDVQLDNVSLEEVIWELERKTDFTFMYWTSEVKDVKVSLNMKQKTINDILDFCLCDTDLKYEINGEAIVIHRAKDEEPEKKHFIIKGVVKDRKGEPLPGVTIIEKGTSVGVTSGIKGEFVFSTSRRDSVALLFSFVGMKTKEVIWKGQRALDVVLEEDVLEVEEVVVNGYQPKKRSNMAGSASVIKAEELVFTGTNSLEQALQGKLPGVVIQSASGQVGTRQKVRVRGTSTLLGSQEPVWVVDGIIQEDPLPFKAEELNLFGQSKDDSFETMRNFIGNSISWLNPNDIEDITVLNDASATAIYGVKAANGVIVITTKRGKAGRLSVSYSGNYSIGSKVTYDKLDLMNSKERIDVSREVYESGYVSQSSTLASVGYAGLFKQYLEDKISYEAFNSGVKKLETMNTDWFDLLFENPFSHSHNISVSGGSDKSTYRFSFGITNNNGTAKGNDSETYNGSMNISTIFKEKLTLMASLAGSMTKTNGFNGTDPYQYAYSMSRAIPCYNEDGSLFYYKDASGYNFNILNELANMANKNRQLSMNANLNATYDIIPGLKYALTFAYSASSTHAEAWAAELSNSIAQIRGYEFGEYGATDDAYKQSKLPHGGKLDQNETRMESWTLRNQVSFVRTFNRHLVTATIGQESRSTRNEAYAETIYGYLPSRGKSIMSPPITVQNSFNSGVQIANTLYEEMGQKITDNISNYLSYYATLDYSFDERYSLNSSIRWDASNRFGEDKNARYQPVWSVGLRYNFGREHFMKNQRIINDLSFRFSYGFQGNVSEAATPDLIAAIPGSGGVTVSDGEYYLTISKLPNPTLKWEKNKSINLGVDFTLLNRHISGTFEYYYKRGTDIVVNASVPHCNGVTSLTTNGGTMKNSGWELSFNFVPLRLKEFVWTIGFNTSKNDNKVTSNLEQSITWQKAAAGDLTRDGYPVSSFWAFAFTGLNEEDGAPEFDFFDAENDPNVKLDATTYMKHMGKMDPDLSAGLSTSIRYKSFTLSAGFSLQIGGKKFLAPVFDDSMINTTPNEYNNLPKSLVNRWRKPSDKTNIPSLPYNKKGNTKLPDGQYTNIYRLYNYADIRVADAWFLKCNNISASYNFPERWIKGFAQNINVNFSVSQPFRIVSKDFKGMDPEVAIGNQPISRNYSLGINISF